MKQMEQLIPWTAENQLCNSRKSGEIFEGVIGGWLSHAAIDTVCL